MLQENVYIFKSIFLDHLSKEENNLCTSTPIHLDFVKTVPPQNLHCAQSHQKATLPFISISFLPEATSPSGDL